MELNHNVLEANAIICRKAEPEFGGNKFGFMLEVLLMRNVIPQGN